MIETIFPRSALREISRITRENLKRRRHDVTRRLFGSTLVRDESEGNELRFIVPRRDVTTSLPGQSIGARAHGMQIISLAALSTAATGASDKQGAPADAFHLHVN